MPQIHWVTVWSECGFCVCLRLILSVRSTTWTQKLHPAEWATQNAQNVHTVAHRGSLIYHVLWATTIPYYVTVLDFCLISSDGPWTIFTPTPSSDAHLLHKSTLSRVSRSSAINFLTDNVSKQCSHFIRFLVLFLCKHFVPDKFLVSWLLLPPKPCGFYFMILFLAVIFITHYFVV